MNPLKPNPKLKTSQPACEPHGASKGCVSSCFYSPFLNDRCMTGSQLQSAHDMEKRKINAGMDDEIQSSAFSQASKSV